MTKNKPCLAVKLLLLMLWTVENKKIVTLEIATFASGAFQHAEAKWGCVKGVMRTRVGYISLVQWKHPHAVPKSNWMGTDVEAVELEYNPKHTNYSSLLDFFWTSMHNHVITHAGRPQYKPAIYCHTEEQCNLAHATKAALEDKIDKPVITEVQRNNTFLEADLASQKMLLQAREEVFSTLKLSKRQLIRSHTSTLLNSYLAGQCHGSRTWDEIELAIMDLELSIEQLATMGLEILHPDVMLTPGFGQTELSPANQRLMERQLRLRRERRERKEAEVAAEAAGAMITPPRGSEGHNELSLQSTTPYTQSPTRNKRPISSESRRPAPSPSSTTEAPQQPSTQQIPVDEVDAEECSVEEYEKLQLLAQDEEHRAEIQIQAEVHPTPIDKPPSGKPAEDPRSGRLEDHDEL